MSFNLELTLTGICAFVANSSGAGPVCVVMPSTDTNRTAIDEELLCPHVSYVEQGEGFMINKFPLNGYRLSFDLTEGDTINPGIVSIQKANATIEGLLDIADTGIDYATDPGVVSFPPPLPVVAQVILEKGYVSFYSEGGLWDFDPLGSGVLAAHEVRVKILDLESASAKLESFGENPSTVFRLDPPDGVSPVRLKIVNTCARKSLRRNKPKSDRDFKWYYELLDQSDAGPIQLGNRDLPIPRLVGRVLIGGNNCFPSLMKDAPINLA